MEQTITDGRYNEKVERNEKNKIKLFLEASLRKKVEKESIKLLNVDKKYLDVQRVLIIFNLIRMSHILKYGYIVMK